MPSIRKSVIRATINPQKLYSKAEDVALKMKQLKNIGSDARRHFIKQGVTKEELEELGLAELFEQRRVTQDEILTRIKENEIEFEERVDFGGRVGDIDTVYDNLDIEDFYGPDGLQEEIDYQLGEYVRDRYQEDFANGVLDPEDTPELARWANREIDETELPTAQQNELYAEAEEMVRMNYADDPAEYIQLVVDGQELDGYRLIRTPYENYFTPDRFAPDHLQRAFGMGGSNNRYSRDYREIDTSVRGEGEAALRLRMAAEEYGDIEFEGDTRHAEFTVPGGSNYREYRLSLPGTKKFSESYHFPDDQNNVFHARTTDRLDGQGNNVLFVEELQSDWAQRGRQGGFLSPETLAKGEDEIRNLLEANDIPEAIRGFRDRFDGYETVPSYLMELYDAANPRLPYREKLSQLTKFSRDYQRRLNDLESMHYTDRMMELATQDEKLYMARFLTEEANRRIGAPGLESDRYKVPDPTTKQGLDELDVLAERYIKRSLDGATSTPEPASLFGRLNRIAPQVREEAAKYANGVMEDGMKGFGLPTNFYKGLEESIDSIEPGYAARLREEARKPQVAPFVRDTNAWNKLAVKRLIAIAEEEGYDKVMFSPSSVQLDRWGEQGLVQQYDVNIPKAIKQVTGIKPGQSSFSYDDYNLDAKITGPSIDLQSRTPTGETVAERAKTGQTMFAVPVAAAAGLAGLAAPDMAEAEEIPIEEGIGKLPRRTGGERGILEEVGDFVRYGPEVGLDALNAMILRPVAGSLAGRGAFDLGMDEEAIRRAQQKAESLVDYEASPGAEAYGQRIMGGIGDLLESETAQRAAPYVMPVIEGLEAASEGLTSGIIGLNERLYSDDEDERVDALLEVIRPGIEATQPI